LCAPQTVGRPPPARVGVVVQPLDELHTPRPAVQRLGPCQVRHQSITVCPPPEWGGGGGARPAASWEPADSLLAPILEFSRHHRGSVRNALTAGLRAVPAIRVPSHLGASPHTGQLLGGGFPGPNLVSHLGARHPAAAPKRDATWPHHSLDPSINLSVGHPLGSDG